MKLRIQIYNLIGVLVFSNMAFGQLLNKTMDDDNSKFTNIGNIGLALSNYGVYGNGLRNLTQANHPPSCEYPSGSGIEHLFVGGLWIGGFKKDNINSNSKVGPFVTTGAVDASSLISGRNGGFEFTNTPGSRMVERSNLLESRYYNPNAISHQDFVMDFHDTSLVYSNGAVISEHDPLGIGVHHETYCWNFPFADFFVIMNYTIKNLSGKYLDSVYVGLWTDAVVRNTKITTSTNTAFFSHGGNGYSDSMRIAYEYDADGDVGFTDSYFGMLYLGSTPESVPYSIVGTDTIQSTSFNSWTHNNTADPNFFAPSSEVQRYGKLQGYFGGTNRYNKGINPADLRIPSNRSILISHGYFKNIAPGDSINVVYAILCAKKSGNDIAKNDSREQRQNLYNNADWALRAYFGNDKNRDGIIDPSEDLFGDGKNHRYILPAPPNVPVVKVIPESNKATIYWDKRAEASIDPISGKKDFGGYKIYRTQSGFDLNLNNTIANSLVLLAQMDSAGVAGYNNGFKTVELAEPVTFPGDTTKYYYKYEVNNLLNGWQYLFSVTAFDKGDEVNNLSPLESSYLANLQRILPGVKAVEEASAQVGVYPNPYYGNAIWDGTSERLRKIYFYNLPADCEITIYTLAGDVVKRIHHDVTSNGSDVRWFNQYASDGKQKFAGGEHAWDLITNNDQAIATGLYLFAVKNNKDGNIKTGKFLVVK
ncbi:MAG: hypothetical protein HYV28_02925 [Ignavibacteriales bacterium]|nr:hypothetical protein [Ignavibacteriales bacterium]